MGQVHNYVSQNQNSICNSLTWLIENCQLASGSFKENSHYQPIKLQVREPNVQISNSFMYMFEFHSHPILERGKREEKITCNPARNSSCIQAKNLKDLLRLLFRPSSIGQISGILDIIDNSQGVSKC